MAAVIRLKSSDGRHIVRVRGTAEKDAGAQRIVAREGDVVTGEFPLDEIDIWYNESEPAQAERTQAVRADERLQLAWALTWPGILLELVYQLLRSRFAVASAEGQLLDLLFAFAAFFLFNTWVIRRTVNLDFSGFHLFVTRRAGEVSRAMNYAESLSVAWLLCWRACAVMLPLLIPVLVAITLARGQRHWEWSVTQWLFISVFEVLLMHLWLVQAAIRKNFAGFSLGLERSLT